MFPSFHGFCVSFGSFVSFIGESFDGNVDYDDDDDDDGQN